MNTDSIERKFNPVNCTAPHHFIPKVDRLVNLRQNYSSEVLFAIDPNLGMECASLYWNVALYNKLRLAGIFSGGLLILTVIYFLAPTF